MEHAHEHAKLLEENAKQSIRRARHNLKIYGAQALRPLEKSFKSVAIPRAMETLNKNSAHWTSKASLLKPKQVGLELAEQAKNDFIKAIEQWSSQEGSAVVSKQIEDALEALANDTSDLQIFLEKYGSLSGEQYLARVKTKSIETAFGTALDIDSGEVVLKGMITAALSVILGYVIADVILFYILAVITGFLNPWLLAAAAVAAVPIALFGQGMLRNHLKRKIISKIDTKLKEADTLERIRDGLSDALDAVFSRLSEGFHDTAQALVDEVTSQSAKSQVELENMLARIGNDPIARRNELNRMIDTAACLQKAIDQLRSRLG